MDWESFLSEFDDVEIPDDEPVFPLQIVCHLLDMQYWTLHEIMKQGLIAAVKKKKQRKKFFSRKELKKLKIIKYLMDERGVNIQGVKLIFELKEE